MRPKSIKTSWVEVPPGFTRCWGGGERSDTSMPGAELQVASSPGMATSWAATRAREDQLFRPGAAPSFGPAATFSLGPIARAASPRPGGFVNLGKQRRQAAPTAGPVPPPPTTLGPIETNDAIKADGGWNDVRPPSVAHAWAAAATSQPRSALFAKPQRETRMDGKRARKHGARLGLDVPDLLPPPPPETNARPG